jgi:3-demethoxyubiquinol 3-hydroxylase
MPFSFTKIMDTIINHIDDGLRTSFTTPNATRENPAQTTKEPTLTTTEQKKSCALMRINHTGEVCAQALYRGQMLVAKHHETLTMLQTACDEETDHLAWTAQRISELNGRCSYLNLMWYIKSFCIGVIAGLAGDELSLGFIEETELQVGRHLDSHLAKLPQDDKKSRIIIRQMLADELQHAQHAKDAGGTSLPRPVRAIMAMQSKVMTTLTYVI